MAPTAMARRSRFVVAGSFHYHGRAFASWPGVRLSFGPAFAYRHGPACPGHLSRHGRAASASVAAEEGVSAIIVMKQRKIMETQMNTNEKYHADHCASSKILFLIGSDDVGCWRSETQAPGPSPWCARQASRLIRVHPRSSAFIRVHPCFHCFVTTGTIRDRWSRSGTQMNTDERGWRQSTGARVRRPLGLKSPANRQRHKSFLICVHSCSFVFPILA
jgi:hypothetical protein